MPSDISATERNNLTAFAKDFIKTKVIPAFTKMLTYIEDTYMKNTRPKIGVSSLKDGRKYYEACLKWHLSIDISPEEIRDQGIKDVNRILKELKKIMASDNFVGSFKDYVAHLRNKTELFYKTEQEILDGYIKMIDEKFKPKLNLVLKEIPDYKLSVERTQNRNGPTGRYNEPPIDGSRPGVFEANVFDPETRPKYNMVSLALHESVPGHHTQVSAALVNKLPYFRRAIEYRKYYSVPFNWPFQTAYIEGWAMYAEDLGEEMGVYENNYHRFGKYSSEIFRAARLVVDTGIHAFDWTYDEAIQYLQNTTTLPDSQIRNEIQRYISWPGQATAYKIGQIHIWKLRNEAKDKLGAKFDAKEFNQEVLNVGPAPLSVLSDHIDNWITSITNTSGSAGLQVSFLTLTFILFSIITLNFT